MEKKDSLLVKVSRDFLKGQKVFFATKHAKEKILEPLFSEIEMTLVAARVDTDQFGTFSGEVERKGSVRDTLREKIKACELENPEAQFSLASEGSFMPHPYLGFLPSNLESLLLRHRDTGTEIYSEYLSVQTVHSKENFGSNDDYTRFLKDIDFPNQHVIVHPVDSLVPVFKGLRGKDELLRAIDEVRRVANLEVISISTDLRATGSPSRRRAIYNAGVSMLDKLKSKCPDCNFPGFGVSRSIAGLECECCGAETMVTKNVVHSCSRCAFEAIKHRPDGRIYAEVRDCSYCNP